MVINYSNNKPSIFKQNQTDINVVINKKPINHKKPLAELGRVDQEKGSYFCFKCWKDFPLNEKDDHILVHEMEEEEKRAINSIKPTANNKIQNYKYEDCHFTNQDIKILNSSVQKIKEKANPFETKAKNIINPFTKQMNSNDSKKNTDIDTLGNKTVYNRHNVISNINNNNYINSNNYNCFVNFSNNIDYSNSNSYRGNQKKNHKARFSDNDKDSNSSNNLNQNRYIHQKNTFNQKIQDLGNIVDLLQDKLVDDNKIKMNTPETELDQKINQLSETTIESLDKFSSDDIECSICLIDYKLFDKCIYLPCIHYFHSHCIKVWLGKKPECPICLLNPFEQNS